MITQIKLSKLFLPILILLLTFSFFILPNITLGEGQNCDPNDPTAECNAFCDDSSAINYLKQEFCIFPPTPLPTPPPGGSLCRGGATCGQGGQCEANWYICPAGSSCKYTGNQPMSCSGSTGTEVCAAPMTNFESCVKDTPPPTCSINYFSAGPTTSSGALLTASLNNPGGLRWNIQDANGQEVKYGTNSGDTYQTGPITFNTVYTLTCGTAVPRTATVLSPGSTNPPSCSDGKQNQDETGIDTGGVCGNGGTGGGSSNWCGTETSPPVGPRITVPPEYILLGSCLIKDYSNNSSVYGVPGSTLTFSGNCTPPSGTNRVIMNINMDDGGSVRVKGVEVYSVAPTCSIKNNDVEITNMTSGASNNVSVTAVNSGLAGVGADANFYFYSSGSGGGNLLTPSVQAPSCSNTNYTVTISWPPVNNDIRIFIDPKDFDKVLNGSSGSTQAPDGFNQRLPGGPSPLLLVPGVKYFTSIQNNSADNGPTVEWTVPLCTPSPDLTTSSISPTTITPGVPTNLSATISNTGSVSTGGTTVGGGGFSNIFQISDYSNGANPTTSTPISSPVLFSGGNTLISKSYTFSPGTKYVRVCADKSSALDTGAITESNEDNNCGTWTAVFATCPTNTTWSSTSNSCVAGGCNNGATNYPVCDNICANGATNYPLCTISSNLPDLVAGTVFPNTAFIGIPTTFSALITNIGNAATDF
jgi:hypothetical protein